MIIWFTGQPGSGKSTLAELVGADFLVDGDDLRKLDNPGYDEDGRRQNIDRAQAIAAYLDDQGYSVAVALVSPYRDQRERFKTARAVHEFYLHTDSDLRQEYHVAEYEPPLTTYTDIDTGRLSIREAVRLVHRTLAAAPSRP